MPDEVWAIVVAAGAGRRFGRPKQFEQLRGRLVVEWSVEGARSITDKIVLVVPSTMLNDPSSHCGCAVVVAGGNTRAESVRAGLAEVPPSAAIIVVHDAARPLATPALFAAVVETVRQGADAAIPGVPVADTIKRVDGNEVVETLVRDELVAIQTPQGFAAAALRRGHELGLEATDDAALVEASGGSVVVVAGESGNVKITELADLERLAGWLGETIEAKLR